MATKSATQPTSDQWQKLATAMGISVPQAHQEIKKAQGFLKETGQPSSTQDVIGQFMQQVGASPSQTQLREGAEQYGAYTSKEWAALSPEDKAQAISGYVNDPNTQYFSPGTQKKVEAEVKSPGPQKPLPDPQSAATNAPESPFTQLAQALASEYLGQVQQLMPLTSGSALFGPQGDTTGLANSAAAGIGGPAGSWLQGLASQEQSDASKSPGGSIPSLQGSMNQVGEAASKGAIGMSGAIANMGPAETQFLQTAPWQQILSELASETAYKAASGQGASAFGLTPQNTPAWLSQVLQSHGLGGTAGSAGLAAPGTAAKKGGGSNTSVTASGTSQTG